MPSSSPYAVSSRRDMTTRARLKDMQHFELVSESDLHNAQATLLEEIQPEIKSLLSTVEAHLDRLERREKSLIAKCELQEGRLGRAFTGGRASGGLNRKPSTSAPGGDGLKGLEEVKALQVRQKKERLSYAVGRLELQASQRERQLRKSMAVQGAD